MPLSITVTIKGDQETRQRLQGLGSKLTDFSGAMKTIGSELKGYYSGQVFASQGGALGQKWRPLVSWYAKVKAKRYPGKGILEATGAMRHSFKSKDTKNSTTIYNDDPKFISHQLGLRPGLPARPMLGVNNEVKSIVQRLIQADIDKKLASTK